LVNEVDWTIVHGQPVEEATSSLLACQLITGHVITGILGEALLWPILPDIVEGETAYAQQASGPKAATAKAS
jgi:hypothetical protein